MVLICTFQELTSAVFFSSISIQLIFSSKTAKQCTNKLYKNIVEINKVIKIIKVAQR